MTLIKTLYKKDSKDKMRLIEFHLDKDQYWMVTGLVDGKKVTSKPTTATSKNVGRSNETTPETQAQRECASKIQKKLDDQYHTSIEAATMVVKDFRPMLADAYFDRVDKLQFPCIVQPKLDGIRANISRKPDGSIQVMSRNGKPFNNRIMALIIRDLEEYFERFPEAVVDGELYVHNQNFEDLVSIIKKVKPSDEDITHAWQFLEYHIYDVYHPDKPKMKYTYRVRDIVETEFIHKVESHIVFDSISIEEIYHKNFVARDYEGSMIRDMNAPYEVDKRSRFLLKLKDFIDKEYIVKDILSGKGNRAEIAGRIVYTTKENKEFKSGIRGTHGHCEALLLNKDSYIGNTGTVRFFEYTKERVPRFPITIVLNRESYEGAVKNEHGNS